MRSAPCLLVLAGVVHFSASPPVFPTCTKKCDEFGARVCMGQNRVWDRVKTSPLPRHLKERWEGLVPISPTVVKRHFIPAAAYWMRLIWGKVHLIHSRDCSTVSTLESWYISVTHGKPKICMRRGWKLGVNCCFSTTVAPLFSGHSLVSGQWWMFQNYWHWETANKTPINRWPLLSGRGQLFVVLVRECLLSFPLLRWQIRVRDR